MSYSRRSFLLRTLAAGAVTTSALPARAEDSLTEIGWADLIPDSGGEELEALRQLGVVQHGEMSTPFDQEKGGLLTKEFDGKRIRIPGYLVPLAYDGTGVTAALLVPYVGACIHVPPPPPNQLIYVTTGEPYESVGLFEPVYVTGMFGAAATATQLAEVGYALSAEEIKPYS